MEKGNKTLEKKADKLKAELKSERLCYEAKKKSHDECAQRYVKLSNQYKRLIKTMQDIKRHHELIVPTAYDKTVSWALADMALSEIESDTQSSLTQCRLNAHP